VASVIDVYVCGVGVYVFVSAGFLAMALISIELVRQIVAVHEHG
jgi:hypothetical protein